jgi:hypothetical protein
LRELEPEELEGVAGGMRTIVAPSGAVYYMEGSALIGVDDPATGTCHYL